MSKIKIFSIKEYLAEQERIKNLPKEEQEELKRGEAKENLEKAFRASENLRIKDRFHGKFAATYVDKDFNLCSGIECTKELCNKCYNAIVGSAYKKMRRMEKLYKNDITAP